MKKSIFFIIVVSVALCVCSFSYFMEDDPISVKLINSEKSFEAGEVTLNFESNKTLQPELFIHYSYGSSIIKGEQTEEQTYSFKLPSHISEKTGTVNWAFIEKDKTLLKGEFYIKPKATINPHLESYFGPRSIQAGKDFSMLVVVATDSYDNPLPDSTSINIKKQFQDKISNFTEETKNLMAWKNIYSEEKSGIIAVSSTCYQTSSKEFVSQVFPSVATNFKINYTRNHSFADGNQLTEFFTSIIKDEFGNVLSDGTMVEFIIQNKEHHILKTFASTISGVARAKMLHPDKEETWTVKAYISGIAESEPIELSYQSVLESFNVIFSEENRKISVGPLKSYMKQLIPDGAVVELEIYNNHTLVEVKKETSSKGKVIFNLPKAFYPEKSYSFIIKALGITKEIGTKNYE